MIDLLAGLDVVEKHPVDHRLTRRGDRREQRRRAGRIGARNGALPLGSPVGLDPRHQGAGMRSRNAGWSRSGWPTPLSPQSSRVMSRPLPRRFPEWKSPWTRVSGTPHAAMSANRRGRSATKASSVARRPAARAVRSTTSAIFCCQRGAAKVGETESEELVGPSDPLALQINEERHHREVLRLGGLEQVLARDRCDQGAAVLVAKKDGHALALEHRENGALMRKERRHRLEPDVAGSRRDPPEAREVPRLDLHRRAVGRNAALPQHRKSPREIDRWTARSRITLSQRVVVERAGPAALRAPAPRPRPDT